MVVSIRRIHAGRRTRCTQWSSFGSDTAKNADKFLVDDLSDCDKISNYISPQVGRAYFRSTVSVERRPIKYIHRFKRPERMTYTRFFSTQSFTNNVHIELNLFLTDGNII